jgi:hypothetical protein
VRLALACLALLALVARPAAAGPPIVIESFHGDRLADAEPWLVPVRAELGRRGFLAGPALAAALAAGSRTVRPLTAGEAVAAKTDVDRAYDHLIEGEYAAAVTAGQRALTLYDAAALTREPAMRDLQFRALIIVARAHEALDHRDDSVAAMAEAVRTFPERTVSTAEFDPRVRDLQRRVRQALLAQGTGSLDLRADDPSAVLFVNERFVGTGAARVDDLPAGTYRVHAARGARVGRVHTVAVAPRGVASLTVPWQLEAALRTDAGGVILDAAPERELALAGHLARSLDAPRVVILTVRTIGGRRAVAGQAIVTATQARTFGAIQVEPLEPAPASLSALGAFLAGARDVDTRHLVLREPGPAAPPMAPWYRDRWGWTLAGAGTALLAGSVATVWSARDLQADANREPVESTRRDLRDRADACLLASGVLASAGAALAIAGVVRLVLTEEPPVQLLVAPDHIALRGSF